MEMEAAAASAALQSNKPRLTSVKQLNALASHEPNDLGALLFAPKA